MSAQLKKHPFDFKTQYGLGFNPQDDDIVVDFFCGGGGAGLRIKGANLISPLKTSALADCGRPPAFVRPLQPATNPSLNYRPGLAIFASTFFPMLMRGSVE
jgi:hypothetical protein